LERLPLACRGPDGQTLAIDIAWIGSETPRHVVIHCSGVHGVEGFTGSAIQLRALETIRPVDSDDAVIFVHVLNPFGMAWLRRVNEHNVDLNRNWREPGTILTGMPDLYREIDTFLNPTDIPSWDSFYLRAALLVRKYGMRTLRQAIAGGQYERPDGLFYGGRHLEQGPARFRAWLQRSVSSTQRLSVIDVHTGLGRWRQNSLFAVLDGVDRDELPAGIRASLAPAFETSDVGGYAVQGAQVDLYRQLFPGIPLMFLTQEFGTYSGVRVLKALRRENYQHHHGDPDGAHPSQRVLRDIFCPRSTAWRAGVLDDGLTLFQAAL
jgi:predicted deacylase